jgi:hypothetical protein
MRTPSAGGIEVSQQVSPGDSTESRREDERQTSQRPPSSLVSALVNQMKLIAGA